MHKICVSCRFVFRLYKELIGLLQRRRACLPAQSVSVWILDHYTCARGVSVFICFITTCGKIVGFRSTVRRLNLVIEPSEKKNGFAWMRLWFLIDSEVKDGVSVGGRAAYQSYPEQQKINDYQIGGLSSVWKSASKKVNLEDLDCTAASSEWLFKWFIWHDWAFVSPFSIKRFSVLESIWSDLITNNWSILHPLHEINLPIDPILFHLNIPPLFIHCGHCYILIHQHQHRSPTGSCPGPVSVHIY